jgi:bile acid:Na+ symporter, BASS family
MNTADQAVVHFNENQVLLLNICLGFLMFGVALDLKLAEFREVSKNVRSIITGLISQWVMLPLLTLALIWVFKPQMSIAMGMILVASCPGGNVSNYAVYLAGANTWLSVILTTFSTFFCVVSTPLVFNGMSRLLYENNALSVNFDISFYQMAGAIFQLLFVPMLLGIAMSHYYPKQTTQIKSWVKKLSMMIFIGFVIAGIWTNRENIGQYVHLVFLLVLVHNGLALAGGYGMATLGCLKDKDRRAVSIETGIQNSGLALVLIFNFFDGIGGMALIAAWWSIWHLISALSVALYWRNHRITV